MIYRNKQGFTLLELLVALAIFSILSVMAYGGLKTVINSKQANQAVSDRLAEVQMAMLRITNDLRQAVPRKIRNEFGDTLYAMQINQNNDDSLEWSRAGYRNPAQLVRSHLQRVAYKFDHHTLQRITWPVLDRSVDTKEIQTEVLNKVESLHWRFLNSQNEWITSWPGEADKAEDYPLPKAVEINLELQEWGKIRRLIILVDNP